MNRWKLLLSLAITLGLVVGIVTISFGSSSALKPAEDGEDSYALSDFSVSYPLAHPTTGEMLEGVAGVTLEARATTGRYAGDVRCEVRVFDADSVEVGRSEYWLGFDGAGPMTVGPIEVPVERTPSSAQGFCEAAQPADPEAGYVFSDLETVLEPNPALVGTISWKSDSKPGEFLCTATLKLSTGQVEVPFSIAQSEGHGVIVLLSKEAAQGKPVDVSCEPMVGRPLA